MKLELKEIIQAINPVFESDSSFNFPLPNEVSLYLYNKDWSVDLKLKQGVLNTEIYKGEDLIDINKESINFIFDYLDGLLENEIDLTKEYYSNERYNEETNYYIK